MPPPEPVIDNHVRACMAATGTPGGAYAIVHPTGMVHHRTWGRDGRQKPVTTGTPFLWGSVSKPVTATAVMTLADAGRLDLDSPVRSHLPWFRLGGRAATDRITVRHLLAHTSGIPAVAGVTDRFAQVDDPYRQGPRRLARVSPASTPGQRHLYTSANYLLLGAVVEAVTGRRFEQHLDRAVLQPLDMTGAITTPAHARSHLPPGHRYVLGRPVAMASPYDPAGASYGYLGGPLGAMARFAAVHLAGGSLGRRRLLTETSVRTMHRGVAPVNDHTAYGLGWRDTRRDGLRLVWHAGAVAGYHAVLALLPDQGRAVVVLQNAYGPFHDNALLAAGLGAARLLGAQDRGAKARGAQARRAPQPAAPANVRYLAMVGATGSATVLSAAALARSIHHLGRPPRSPATEAWRAPLWMAAAALAVGATRRLPRKAGVRLRDLPLWAPDLGWSLMAITVAAGLVAPTRLLALRRSCKEAVRASRRA